MINIIKVHKLFKSLNKDDKKKKREHVTLIQKKEREKPKKRGVRG